MGRPFRMSVEVTNYGFSQAIEIMKIVTCRFSLLPVVARSLKWCTLLQLWNRALFHTDVFWTSPSCPSLVLPFSNLCGTSCRHQIQNLCIFTKMKPQKTMKFIRINSKHLVFKQDVNTFLDSRLYEWLGVPKLMTCDVLLKMNRHLLTNQIREFYHWKMLLQKYFSYY